MREHDLDPCRICEQMVKVLQESISERIVEQMVHVPVSRILEETVESVQKNCGRFARAVH